MTYDPELVASLEAVVAADPGNATVRLHLASLLLEAGRARESLNHARAVLTERPADRRAVQLAAKAAEAAGEHHAAAGYGELLDALGGVSPGSSGSVRYAEPSTGREAAATSKPEPGEPVQVDLPGAPSPRVSPPRLRVIRGGGENGRQHEEFLEAEVPVITFQDVAGLAEVKRRLELAFLAPLRNPEIGRMYGKTMRGGLLLYGPPGCGKTYLARAASGELGARFLSVGLSDVLDMWIGQSERNLHDLFELARRQAPCVLFVDEIDALGRKRSLMRHAAGMTMVVNQFLAELDGVDSTNEGVFVLAATNHPWDVDTALRRPGRLDRMLLVLPPDQPARRAILERRLTDLPTESLDLEWIAARTDGFSGADLAHLCDTAVEYAMEDSLSSGVARPIRQKDLKLALKELRPSTRPWFDTARNYALFSNEGGTYDELLAYLREKRMA